MQYVEIELDPQEIVPKREVLWWWTITSKWKPFLAMVPEEKRIVR
jgi:hypothetical protein